MKAISLWQPWASAMALGKKKNETRHWATAYRGDLAICSAQRKPSREEVGEGTTYQDAMALPYGCALCVVELYDCVPTESLSVISQAERELGDYTPGRWAWLTRNLRTLKQPVPVIGRQGFWNLPPDVETAVRENLR